MKASDRLLKLAELTVGKDVNGSVIVSFKNSEVKEGSMLVGVCGRGINFEEACVRYMDLISGKTLVFNSCISTRKEVTVL